MLELLLLCQIGFATFIQVVAPTTISDGPYIFHQKDGTLKSISIVENEVISETIKLQEAGTKIPTTIPFVPIISLGTKSGSIPASKHELPSKLLAVSDLEGNLPHLIQFLQTHNIIDMNFDWAWGNGHLLFNGDSVDRGEQVTELLWFIRKLQQQANVAGGQVHFVLGNHDVMIMADDIRYTHNKYKSVAKLTGIPYHELFGETSVLGKWLRNQNSIVQIGPYIFVHAGFSPELHKTGLSLTEINNRIRLAIGPPAWPDRDELATSLAWHSKGPLWYRGYFDKHAEKYGPKPTEDELQAILNRHNAKAIIVGHTVTGNVGYLDGNKHLIGIDVHWDTMGEGEGLLITNGVRTRLTSDGESKELLDIQTGK